MATVTYGGHTVTVDGKIRMDDSFDRASVEFDFISLGASGWATDEAAYRKVRQDLSYTVGSHTKTLKHSDYTGFDSYATIMKREDIADTGVSRRYTVRIEFGRPADVSQPTGAEGRRSSSVAVALDPQNIATVTISGVWTALPSSTSARSAYNAKKVAFCDAVMTALGITVYNFEEETLAESNTDNTVLSFSRRYRQIIYNENGQANDPDIKRQALVFTRHKVAPGDSLAGGTTVQRLIVVTATYEARIDSLITTALKTKWDAIRLWIIGQAKSVFSLSAAGISDEQVHLNVVENIINATLEITGASGTGVVENVITTKDVVRPGWVLIPQWDNQRNPFTKYLQRGPGQVIRIITEKRRVVGNPFLSPFSDPLVNLYPPPTKDLQGDIDAPKSIITHEDETRTPLRIGMDGETLDVVDFDRIVTIEYYASPQGLTFSPNIKNGETGGGGDGSGTTPTQDGQSGSEAGGGGGNLRDSQTGIGE